MHSLGICIGALTISFVELAKLELGNKEEIHSQLDLSAKQLTAIQLKRLLSEAKIVSLSERSMCEGKNFLYIELMNSLLERGFVVKTAPISEYLYYSIYLLKRGIVNGQTLTEKSGIFLNSVSRNSFQLDVPFLHVETDSNSFPQITQSKIEIFMMQAERVYNKMKEGVLS